MLIQNHKYRTDGEIRDIIAASESRYDAEIMRAAEAAHSHPELRFVMLSGPTCSGKTTTASRLIDAFSKYGRRVVVVSIDDFYRDNDGDRTIDEDQTVDYESADAIDLEYFDKCTDLIEKGLPCSLPKFDFLAGRRSEYVHYVPHEEDIVLFEGIQGIYPEIVSLIPADKLERIYISVGEDATVSGEHFEKREIRLIRRLVRDYHYRGSEPDFTLYLWREVVANEDKNILPREDSVPFKINSLLSYELNMIKDQFLTVASHAKKEETKAILDPLAEKLRRIPSLDISYLPHRSVFNEFIKRD